MILSVKISIILLWIVVFLCHKKSESLTLKYGFENQPHRFCHGFPFNTSDRHITLKDANGQKIWNHINFDNSTESWSKPYLTPFFVNDTLQICFWNLSRADIGNHILQEVKSGRQFNFSIDVYYGPTELIVEPNLEPIFTIHEYSSLKIYCFAECNPDCDISWWKDKTNILPDFNVLILTNITKIDGGNYSCKAKNPEGTSISKSYEIHVKYLPQINLTPNQNVEVKEYSDVNVSCNVESYPTSNVSWLRDDERLDTIESKKKKVVLFLLNSTCNDTGLYECSAFYDVKRFSKSFKLDVLCKPRFVGDDAGYLIAKKTQASIGDEIVITFKIQANPAPNVKFISQNTFVSFVNLSYTMIAVDMRTLISSDSDFRWYSVIIGNSEGNVAITLEVERKNHFVISYKVIIGISLPLLVLLCCPAVTYLLVKFRKKRKDIKTERDSVFVNTAELEYDDFEITEYSFEDAFHYQNRVREIELTADEAYENLSITEDKTSYEDIRSKTESKENAQLSESDKMPSDEFENNCNIMQGSDGYLIVTGLNSSEITQLDRENREFVNSMQLDRFQKRAKDDQMINEVMDAEVEKLLNIKDRHQDQRRIIRREAEKKNSTGKEIAPKIGKRPSTF